MASKALTSLLQFFPSGTSLKVYARSGWPQGTEPTAGVAPPVAAIDTQSVSSTGTVTFTGLTDDTEYVAGADLGGGAWRYVKLDTARSKTPATSGDLATLQAEVDGDEADLASHTVLKKGVHGLPAAPTDARGLLWNDGAQRWDSAPAAPLAVGTASTDAGRGDWLDSLLKKPRMLIRHRNRYNNLAVGKLLCVEGGTLVADATNLNLQGAFLFDHAFHDITGRVTSLMVTCSISTDAGAPTGTVRGALYVAGAFTGTAGADKTTLGAMVAQTPTMQPAASSQDAQNSGWVDASALSGQYALVVDSAGTGAVGGEIVTCLWVSNQ